MLALAHSVAMLFAARIVDGLSGGNISTARAYVADITEPKDRARAYGIIGAAFGLGFILGPALSGVLAQHQLHGADLGGRGLTLVATVMAWLWLPETVHRAQAGTGNPFRYLPELLRRPVVRRDARDRLHLLVRVRDVPDDVRAVRGAAVRLRRVEDRLFLRGVRRARRRRPGRVHPADRASGSATSRRSCSAWRSARSGSSPAALAHSVALFALALVPLALGIGFGHPTMSSLVSLVGARRRTGARAGRGERGREPRPDDRAGVGQRVASAASARRCRTSRPRRCCVLALVTSAIGRRLTG